MEQFIMLRLKLFLSEHLACDLDVVDTIIVEYIVSVIEDIGSIFDMEDFFEMMTAYIPGFDDICDERVTEWLFDVAAKIADGSWSDDVAALEIELEKWEQMNVGKDENNNAPSLQQKMEDTRNSEDQDRQNKLRDDGMLLFDLAQMPGEDWFTAPSVASNDLFPIPNETNLFPKGDIVFSSPRKSSLPDFTDCQLEPEYDEPPAPNHDPQPGTIKYSDKINQLKEMFPLTPECQLKRCLSRSKSNVEKAVSVILANQNDQSKSSKSKPNEKEKDSDKGASGCVADVQERDICKLKDMFPKLTESRIRDCYNIVGNSCERAMRIIVSEEQSRNNVNHENDRFKAHIVSFKKKDLSTKEEDDLRKEISKKYSYYVDDPEKDHRPVVLVKKDEKANKVSNIFDENENRDNSIMCTKQVEEKTVVTPNKQNNNPKLNRKQRYR